eukprot:TRINITY_DN1279_c0_g6_i1.p1 TRINITY_DN1279_c0_g6~~TRINITY_DN1279_c0_g6_i1.p1  ORF type:complete len:1689 (+),score=476.01 TRINITY_DN1279_c0_g6_i1:247-5067(+)
MKEDEYKTKKAAVMGGVFGRGEHRAAVEALRDDMNAFAAAGEGAAGEATTRDAGVKDAAVAEEFEAQARRVLKQEGRRVHRERRINFIRSMDAGTEATPTDGLVAWVKALPQKGLGYTAAHTAQLLATARHVAAREAKKLTAALAGEAPVEEWMMALPQHGGGVDGALELFLAGALYTMDLVEKVEGKDKTILLTDEAALRRHGVDPEEERRKAAAAGWEWKGQKLPLFYTMNTAMRNAPAYMAEDEHDARACGAALPQHTVLDAFEPLIRKVDALVAALPSCPATVFRGISVNVSAAYRVGSRVVWNAFTSTSVLRDAALYFMGGAKDGTFFVIISKDGAAPVEFCSVYASEERELLYTQNIEFQVMWKLSPTLLRMMGLAFDVVVMQEVRDNGVAAPEVALFKEVFRHAMHFAERFLATYVEGRVGNADGSDVTELFTILETWLFEEEMRTGKPATGPRHPYCLVGVGGAGKTSAAVAATAYLLSSVGFDEIFPVFVPLPSLGRSVLEPGGIDRYVKACFALDDAGLAALVQKYDVVLVLDSMDETGVAGHELREALRAGGAPSLVKLNPACVARSTVLLTVREEYLTATGLSATELCGAAAETGYLQPFTGDDIKDYLEKVVAQEKKDNGEDHPVMESSYIQHELEKWIGDAMQNPFVLSLAVSIFDDLMQVMEDRWTDARAGGRQVQEVDVYQVYLKRAAAVPAGEVLAGRMLASDAWQCSLAEAVAFVVQAGGGTEDEARVRADLRKLPLRVEDWGDDGSTVCFRHKTLAEFLAAQWLWGDVARLRQIGEGFSKRTPNTARFFAGLAENDPAAFTKRVLPGLQDLACREATEAVVANALALAARCRGVLTLSAAPKVAVCDADLRHLVVKGSDLSGARFARCWLDGAEFIDCKVEQVRFEDCHLEASRLMLNSPAALESQSFFYKCLTMSDDGARIAACTELLDDNPCSTAYLWRPSIRADGNAQPDPVDLAPDMEPECVAVTRDGTKVLCGFPDGTVRIWEAASLEVLATLKGHLDTVTCVAASGDGGIVVSGSGEKDKSVRVWNAATGAELHALRGHIHGVTEVAVSDDGTKVVSMAYNADGPAVYVWDAVTGGAVTHAINRDTEGLEQASMTCVAMWKGDTDRPMVVVTGDCDGAARVWHLPEIALEDLEDMKDANRPKLHRKLVGHDGTVMSAALSGDGAHLITGGMDMFVRLWDVAAGKEKARFEGHRDEVCRVAMSRNGLLSVSASGDGTVRLWDTFSGKESQKVDGHTHFVNSVAITSDGSEVVTGGEDKRALVWSAATGRQVGVLGEAWGVGHKEPVGGVAVSRDGKTIFTASSCFSGDMDGGDVAVWDRARCDRITSHQPGKECGVNCVALSSDGTKLVCGIDKAYAGDIVMIDTAHTPSDEDAEGGHVDPKAAYTHFRGHRDPVSCVAISECGTRIVSGARDSIVRVWDATTGQELRAFEDLVDTDCAIDTVAVSADGTWIVVSGREGKLHAFDTSSGNERYTIEHGDAVLAAAISHDGTRVVTGAQDKSVRVHDAASGETLQTLEGHAGPVRSVALSKDGRRLVSGSEDRNARVWDLDEAGGRFQLRAVCGRAPPGDVRFTGCSGAWART